MNYNPLNDILSVQPMLKPTFKYYVDMEYFKSRITEMSQEEYREWLDEPRLFISGYDALSSVWIGMYFRVKQI